MYPGYNMIINTILVFYAIKKLDADSSKQVREQSWKVSWTDNSRAVFTF